MIIAVDAAGGQYAPHEIVKGAVKASQEYGVDIILVGRKNILKTMAARYLKKPGITIVNARQVIEPHEHPLEAMRKKPDSSIAVGIKLIKDGTASAFVSAGNTGAVLVAALFGLGKIKGIERPAIASIMDFTPSVPVLLLDAGANVDCKPAHLAKFAQMGTLYARQVLGIESPRVGLLSNGEEEEKGTKLVQETHKLLKMTDLNFIGNVEGHDIMKRTVDVIVTDGFTGNVVIKTVEGMGDSFRRRLGQVLQSVSTAYHVQGRILLNLVGMSSWAKKIDYREYGGACLLGVNGNVIIAHGRSQSYAIKNAIGLAKQTAERSNLEQYKEDNSEQSD